jgi:glutathione S-transferase
MFLDPPDPTAVQQSRRLLAATLSAMDRELTRSGPWLAGDSYSLADIAAAPVIDRLQRLEMADLWSHLPAFKAWVERVTSRPAYMKAAPPDEHRMPSVAAAPA